MTITLPALSKQSPQSQWRSPLALRIAARELRGGLRGFYVFLFCVALGVSSIAAISSLSQALKSGLSREGQMILGGDVELALNHRRATDKERNFIKAKGALSEVATIRAMAISDRTKKNTLIGLKAVDNAFPLFGKVVLENNEDLQTVIAPQGTVAVDPLLLRRLNLEVGDKVKIGQSVVTIAAIVKSEPDRLSGRPALGPHVLMSLATLKSTGLAAPGSLVRWAYRVKFAQTGAPEIIKSFKDELKTNFAQSGFSVKGSDDPAPVIRRAINQMTGFLTFVGLTALIVGGVGVANGTTTYFARKRKTIAAFKCLGAPSGLIAQIYFLQILIVASLGTLIGLAIGAGLPWGVQLLFSNLLPFKLITTIHPSALFLAAAYGLLVSVLFVLWPLGRAKRVKPQTLIRETISENRERPENAFIAGVVLVAALLIAITIGTAEQIWIALYFCAALAILLGVFYALGHILERFFRSINKPKTPELAIAFTNLGSPGALTRTVTLSLGTGLSLLVAVALIDRSLTAELQTGLPQNAPNYFFLDIGKDQLPAFKTHIEQGVTEANVNTAPMLRGRIVTLAGKPADTVKAAPNAAWVLRGDRGLTYAEEVPKGSKITQGKWWPKNYQGEPLVSFEDELAKGLGLKIGDEVTINVLGRNITARIANLRTLKWESLSINFVMIFSPNTLQAAPFNVLATLHTKKDPETARRQGADGQPGADKGTFVQSMIEKFPNITVIRVKDTIEAVSEIFSRLMLAIRAAGGLTLIAGSLVLAGALATAHQSRIYQAVILKTLGGTRRRIIFSHLFEYLILALATSLFASSLGAVAAWITVTQLMDINFTLSLIAVAQAIVLAVLLVLAFGVAGSWRVLSAKTSPALRANS